MPQASGEFVKVYLYLVRCMSDAKQSLSIPEMADIFNQTEADIIRSLRYWDKTGVIRMEFDNMNSRLTGITITDLHDTQVFSQVSPETAPAKVQPPHAKVQPVEIDIQTVPDNQPYDTEAAKAAYTPKKIQELKSSEDFSLLLYPVETYLGGPLNYTSMQTIAYLYDDLKFSASLIEFLVEYCVSRGHKSIRYIEKVALNWAAAGISSVKEAKQEISSHNETTYSVMNAFGIKNREPGQTEKDFITKWTDVYCFDSDMIIEACNRTMRAIHQPSFEYADSILKKWNDSNVKTAADVRKSDAEYDLLKSRKKAPAQQAASNRFNNFHQRNTDINSLETSLISNKV
jgi:DnaD/phage-associated family protein